MKQVFRWLLVAGCGWMAGAAEPSLTIYNQNFAVVRQTLPLDLRKGVNRVQCSDTTAHLEPESVILRDPQGKHELRILEQNYRADPISDALLLSLYEGRTIDFEVYRQNKTEIVSGRIVRSSYVPHRAAYYWYGPEYAMQQQARAYSQEGVSQPIIEVEGKLRFGLPGTPLFPSLPSETVLKPTLHWLLEAAEAGQWEAELSYITGGMSWNADYNITAPTEGDTLDLVGWVTIDNQSGRSFANAPLKLVAGDVNRVRPRGARGEYYAADSVAMAPRYGLGQPAVTEKAFDEYHLYTITRPATVRDRETKQVEFVRAQGIPSKRLYVYDGFRLDEQRYRGWSEDNIRQDQNYGTLCNPKVWVMREFKNSTENRLGMPLPKGKVRFYRRDTDGPLEFTGENQIDHTPRDEQVRVYTGNAFDLVGERVRTGFRPDHGRNMIDESFEIRLRNHKKETVEVRVVEHLYRWSGWEILEKSNAFVKTDSRTIEFRVQLPPDEEKRLSYTVHYTW